MKPASDAALNGLPAVLAATMLPVVGGSTDGFAKGCRRQWIQQQWQALEVSLYGCSSGVQLACTALEVSSKLRWLRHSRVRGVADVEPPW